MNCFTYEYLQILKETNKENSLWSYLKNETKKVLKKENVNIMEYGAFLVFTLLIALDILLLSVDTVLTVYNFLFQKKISSI